MNFNLDNYYMMENPSPHDDIPSTYEMLEKMSKLWQGIDAEEVGAALSKFSKKMNDDKFKKPEVEYKIL